MKWPLKLYRVNGSSMLPTYQPGDVLITWSWFRPRVGQVVISSHERNLVKRIREISGRAVWLEGDNRAASTDSRQFGPVDVKQISSRVVARVKA